MGIGKILRFIIRRAHQATPQGTAEPIRSFINHFRHNKSSVLERKHKEHVNKPSIYKNAQIPRTIRLTGSNVKPLEATQVSLWNGSALIARPTSVDEISAQTWM